jgi:type IV pilus assembly protein PilY1
MKSTLIKQMTAYLVAACMAAQPAFAAVIDISNVPLGSTAGSGFLPNLLFTLDNSGSMAWDFLPDYVNPPFSGMTNNPCMTNGDGLTSNGNTNCVAGDPPYSAGGAFGSNGVAYDPNFSYLAGLDSNGQPHVNPPSGTLTPTAVPNDAYLAGGTTDVTTSIPDRRYCNSRGVCKRNGQDDTSGNLVSGTDDAGNALAAGQFPYRTTRSNASATIFGLPEMMPRGSFTRAGTTVTVGTITAHGLTTADKIFVNTGNANLNVTCIPVTAVSGPNAPPAFPYTFTYTTGTSGAIAATSGPYRKCATGNFVLAGSTVTVTTGTNHGLVTDDVITTFIAAGNAMNIGSAPVTVLTATTFTYNAASSGTIASTAGFWVRNGLYNVTGTVTGPAVSYRITPTEYCRDVNLTDCVEATNPPALPANPNPACNPNCAQYTIPAYVRFCRSQAEALAPSGVSISATVPVTVRCQLKYIDVGAIQYRFPRYGWFNRDTIKSTVTPYTNRLNRTDCVAAPSCTYTEEIQNYSKWYTYYRTRLGMMKTSVGRSFLPFISNPAAIPPKPDRLRVGLITIHAQDTGTVVPAQYLRIDTFNTTQASNFYTKFYAQTAANATPLQEALSRAGWIFAGQLNTGLTTGIPAADDPIQASCQKNYSLLTTDGFWNGSPGQTLSGGAIGNRDNVNNFTAAPYAAPDFFVSRASGTYDGNLLPGTVAGASPGGSGTLADVAMYYYQTDLRGPGAGPLTSPATTPPGGDVSTNNVQAKSGSRDFAVHQHMNTFTIGLADGLMRYRSDYQTATTGDFANIVNAAPAAGNCYWASGTCDWPSPQANNQSALDDLWHAAVNGRGTFFSALNPDALATGLSNALNSLDVNVASAAAAATSSPQVSQANTRAFSTTYQTSTWSGRAYAQNIDPVTGNVLAPILWEAHSLLLSKVAASGDTRTLWTRDPTTLNKLKSFTWVNLSAAEQAYFKNKCVPLSNMAQCTTLTPAQLLIANDGSSLVGFLRGQTGNEGTAFRDRTEQDPVTLAPVQTILGDIVNSQPVAVRPPFFVYENETARPEPAGQTYPTFRTNNASRSGPLIIGANDGYLHAFEPATGVENWAYTPRFLMPSLYQLADSGYPGQHRFYVDGTPEVTDVFDATSTTWKTIVVGGTNSGGRGYYALDITDPLNPIGLWEFCSDSTLCPNEPVSGFSHSDVDLGFTYGNPVIGRRALDGKWVVVLTSGLNNTNTGLGYFYVLDAITGQILHKVSTGVGSTATPSGLMKIGGYYPDGLNDPNFTHVFGGDQLGNVWRLDMSQAMAAYPAVTTGAPTVMRLATLKDASGRIQPITARPAGTHIGTTRIYYVGTGRYLGNSDLTDPGAASGFAWQQSIYAIKDQLDTVGFTPPASFRTGSVVQQTFSSSGANRTISKNAVDWATKDGFFIDLNPTFASDPIAGNTPGERVVLDIRLILGTLIVTSTIPNAGGGCVPGGNSFQYGLDFKTGGYVGNNALAISGVNVGQFLVGSAIVQTADNSIKALNKTITGQNITTPVPVSTSFQGKRFSYRER